VWLLKTWSSSSSVGIEWVLLDKVFCEDGGAKKAMESGSGYIGEKHLHGYIITIFSDPASCLLPTCCDSLSSMLC
jgi:hypothetical protein